MDARVGHGRSRQRDGRRGRAVGRAVGRVVVLAVAGVLAVTACSSSSGTTGSSQGTAVGGGPGGTGAPVATPNLQLTAALQPFTACDDLLGNVKGAALERVGPYGLVRQGFDETTTEGGAPTTRSTPAAPATTGPTAGSAPQTSTDSAASAPGDATHSETNVQEKGVDEPDVVKTDGKRILAIGNGRLVAVDVSGPAPRNAGSLGLPGGRAPQILMSGDHVLVIDSATPVVSPTDERAVAPQSGATLTLVDIADPAQMKVLDTIRIDGQLVSARMVDGQARVVTSSSPSQLAFVNPSSSGALAQQAAEDANRRIVQDSKIEDWLPEVHIGGGANPSTKPLLDCTKVSHPKTFSGFDVLSVVSVDVNASAINPADAIGVMADGQTVYASKSNLYVATPAYADVPRNPSRVPGTGTVPTTRAPDAVPLRNATSIHKFSIEGRGPAVYRASGEVEGSVLNQYSMSEEDGALRVATTTAPAGSRGCTRCAGTESFVRVLQEADGELQQVGQVGNLGRGEQIKAVRFVGKQGYVVTFRQTDPLYTLDLTDPRTPRLVGELELLGYSAYLHPAGDNLLIGIGQDATPGGRSLGTKVSLFDVADPANPRELQKYVLWNSTSEVEQDFHAFLYWEPTKLAMIPVARAYVGVVGGCRTDVPNAGVCPPQQYLPPFTGALGLTLDRSAITELGRVVNPASAASPGCPRPNDTKGGTTGVRDGGCESPCPPDAMCSGVPTANGTTPGSGPAPAPVDCSAQPCAPVPASTTTTTTPGTTSSTTPGTTTSTGPGTPTTTGPSVVPTTVACPPDAACPPRPDAPVTPVRAGAAIERSLVVGDTLFTYSTNGIKSSSLADLHEKYWLPFA